MIKREKIENSIQGGLKYLFSQIENGLYLEFHRRRHGPSTAWTTACVGSALSCMGVFNEDITNAILSLQHKCGGWSYNDLTPPDSDSTLRVMEYLQKVGFHNKNVLGPAEKFVSLHQGVDGGFSTYLENAWSLDEYPDQKGWSSAHSCVTALATAVLSDQEVIKRAWQYLNRFILKNGPISYWWKTNLYIMYELGYVQKITPEKDSISLSLSLLLQEKYNVSDLSTIETLLSLQGENGSFQPSKQLKIPRPNQLLFDVDVNKVDFEGDEKGILSTAAAIVALNRQLAILS